MDRILKNLLDDFVNSRGEIIEDESVAFEQFVNFSVISSEYNRDFDIEDVTVGKGDDTGIDGVAILANGQLVNSTEDIDLLIQQNNYLEIKYVFVQAKTSPHFESSEINQFAFGVKDFFAETPMLRRNSDIQDWAQLSDYILSKATHFRENPMCKLYYVTAGVWNNDQNNRAVLDTTERELSEMNLFSDVNFMALGAREISTLYRQTKNRISATIAFAEKVTLPDLPDIDQAYYGILPFSEFKKLIVDENGNLRGIFYDNIRDFQGLSNPINSTIKETLQEANPELFTVLNNGVTVVASELRAAGNRFTVIDYQIVNGCQTSNILFDFRTHTELNNLRIPLRLIVTNNEDVKTKITVATNSQTAIKREQLQAMTEFQKNLERYYNSFQGDGRLL